jgi:hypothetical protein
MAESGANMTTSSNTSDCALGSADAEYERLIRQAARLDHVARLTVNVNHGIMRSAVKLRVTDCIRFGIPQAMPA